MIYLAVQISTPEISPLLLAQQSLMRFPSENQSGPSGGTVLTIDAMAPDSAYPTDYLSSVSSWISSLGVTTTAPASAQPTPTSSNAPTPTATDADSCDVSYKFVYDEFQIRGKNFVPASFGTDGSGLKHQIAGCGAITDWNFQLTPTDPTYQWSASGHLPIGTKACVGRAVVSAGGANDDNCHGAG